MNEQIAYRQEGDYQVPDLTLENRAEQTPGKYGILRRKFLMEHRRGTYNHLLLSEGLNKHLLAVDREAKAMMEKLTTELLVSNPLPKTENTMDLTAHRSSIRQQAEEIVLNTLIYA